MKLKILVITLVVLFATIQIFSIQTIKSAVPTATVESPTNSSTGVSKDIENFSITIADTSVHTMNITWITNVTGPWVTINTTVNQTNGTYYAFNTSWASEYNTTYWWGVVVEDGNSNLINETYHFTTLVNTPPAFSSDSVTNVSSSSVNWSVYINDTNGDTFNWTIECNGQNSSANNASNGTKRLSLTGLTPETNYTVYVNATDSYDWTNQTYNITTSENLGLWFNHTVSGSLVTCIGHHTGVLAKYCWNVTTSSGTITGSTGFINHTSENIYYAFSVGTEEEFEITFFGKNPNESDSQTHFIQTTYNAPEEEPEEPDYIPGEGPGPVTPEAYDVNVAGFTMDIRLPIFFGLIIVAIYIFFRTNKKRKRIKVKRR
jgi:hypothetical protein